MRTKLLATLAGLVLLCGLGLYLDALMREEIIGVARFIIYTLVVVFLLLLGGFVIFVGLIFRERLLKVRANRKLAERDVEVMVVTANEGQQVFIRDLQPIAWRNAHLDTRVYATGRSNEPSPIELIAWRTYQLRHRPSAIEAAASPLLAPQSAVDLLAVLDSAQCVLIVGERDAGKTTLLQHVISRRLGRSQVVVLDPHSHPTRWPSGCQVIGTERDFLKIETALKALMVLMNKRYREIGRGIVREGEHPSVTVIIDEWRAIIYSLGKPASDIIKALLAESRKTNIDVFVGTHSERVKALGIEGEGDLKDGFVIVRLGVNKLTKERLATVDYGEGELPVTLPGPFRSPQPQLSNGQKVIEVEPKPTSEEIRILEMYRAGESYRTISQAVYEGKVGQFYNQKIEAVLDKYGEK